MIRRIAFSVAAVCCLAAWLPAEEIEIKSFPSSMDEFIELRDELAQSPAGGAAMFIVALYLYARDPELGMQAIVAQADRRLVSKRGEKGVYKGYSLSSTYLTDYIPRRPYMPSAYFLGTSPEQKYELPGPPYRLSFSTNRHSVQAVDRIKVFVACSGADSDRPVTVQKNNRGIWKVYEYSTLVTGMRPPAEKIDDDL